MKGASEDTQVHVRGSADLLCHSSTTGKMWTALAVNGGAITGARWSGELGYCMDPDAELRIGDGKGDGASLRVADVDGDGATDLVCHQSGSGQLWRKLRCARGPPAC